GLLLAWAGAHRSGTHGPICAGRFCLRRGRHGWQGSGKLAVPGLSIRPGLLAGRRSLEARQDTPHSHCLCNRVWGILNSSLNTRTSPFGFGSGCRSTKYCLESLLVAAGRLFSVLGGFQGQFLLGLIDFGKIGGELAEVERMGENGLHVGSTRDPMFVRSGLECFCNPPMRFARHGEGVASRPGLGSCLCHTSHTTVTRIPNCGLSDGVSRFLKVSRAVLRGRAGCRAHARPPCCAST